MGRGRTFVGSRAARGITEPSSSACLEKRGHRIAPSSARRPLLLATNVARRTLEFRVNRTVSSRQTAFERLAGNIAQCPFVALGTARWPELVLVAHVPL